MKPKSETLFHFTKTKPTLKKILTNGFWPRYCLEDVNWLVMDDVKFVAFPMVCFCDIPLSRVNEHVEFYGEFGIGLTKEWAINNGLTPIHYVSPNSKIPHVYKELVRYLDDGKGTTFTEEWKSLRYLLAHTKPIHGAMILDTTTIDKSFHQESEWRFIAKHESVKDFLEKKEFDNTNSLKEHNANTHTKCMLRITPRDIRYIFVKNDSDIPDIINFIQTEMDDFAASEIKILMSRVTSLESIRLDL